MGIKSVLVPFRDFSMGISKCNTLVLLPHCGHKLIPIKDRSSSIKVRKKAEQKKNVTLVSLKKPPVARASSPLSIWEAANTLSKDV